MLDTLSPAPSLPPHLAGMSIADRMVMVMRANANHGAPTTRDDFKQAEETCDLSDAELDANIGAAKRILTPEVVRQVAPPDRSARPWESDKAYRHDRVLRGAGVIAGLMPDAGQIHVALRTAGFGTLEVGELWSEIIATAGDDFHDKCGGA